MFGRDARDEHALFAFQNFCGDVNDLHRRFARAENHFWKTFAQRAVRVHLGEAEIGRGRGLKSAQDFFARDFPGAKFFQQLNGFRSRHRLAMLPQDSGMVTLEKSRTR
jgi:hypothetical protein